MSAIMAEQGIWDPGNKNEIRVRECARKLSETLHRRSQNLAFWASQPLLFDPTKTVCFFISTSSQKSCAASVLELKKFS